MTDTATFQIPEGITDVVLNTTRVDKRLEYLRELGYTVLVRSMGTGGVLQVKEMLTEYRIQVSYGAGKHNYAYCVIINKN